MKKCILCGVENNLEICIDCVKILENIYIECLKHEIYNVKKEFDDYVKNVEDERLKIKKNEEERIINKLKPISEQFAKLKTGKNKDWVFIKKVINKQFDEILKKESDNKK